MTNSAMGLLAQVMETVAHTAFSEVLYRGKYFRIQLWRWCGYLGGSVVVIYLEKISSSRMKTNQLSTMELVHGILA